MGKRKPKQDPSVTTEADLAELRSLTATAGEVGRDAWQWRQILRQIERGGGFRFAAFMVTDVQRQARADNPKGDSDGK